MSIEMTDEVKEFLSSLLEDELAIKLVILIESGKSYDEILDALLSEMKKRKHLKRVKQ